MSARRLNRVVSIQRRSTTQDATGQQVTTWSMLLPSVSAEILPLSGRELMAAQAVRAEVDHQVTIRYRPGITAADRLVYQGRVFNIHAVMDQDTRHVWLTILCSEGLNNG